MYTYFVAYEFEHMGMFQKLYRRSTVVPIPRPVAGDEELALIQAELAKKIRVQLKIDCAPATIHITALTYLHSRPSGNP